MRRGTQPLLPLDSGWLFLIPGLAMLAACLLLPNQQRLNGQRDDHSRLQAEQRYVYERLGAYSRFIDEIAENDPGLTRRLVAAQLNLVPAGDEPLILSRTLASPVTDWIESTVEYAPPEARSVESSRLLSLTTGRHRLWVIGGAVMCVFIGLMLGPTDQRRQRRQLTRSATSRATQPARGATASGRRKAVTQPGRTPASHRSSGAGEQPDIDVDDHSRWMPPAVTAAPNLQNANAEIEQWDTPPGWPTEQQVFKWAGNSELQPPDRATGQSSDQPRKRSGNQPGRASSAACTAAADDPYQMSLFGVANANADDVGAVAEDEEADDDGSWEYIDESVENDGNEAADIDTVEVSEAAGNDDHGADPRRG